MLKLSGTKSEHRYRLKRFLRTFSLHLLVALTLVRTEATASSSDKRRIELLGTSTNRCGELLGYIVPHLTEGDVRASFGNVSQFADLMDRLETSSQDELSSAIADTMAYTKGSRLLKQVNRDLIAARSDEMRLTICLLHPDCRFKTSVATHVSGGTSYELETLLGGQESPDRRMSAETNLAVLWQALVLRPHSPPRKSRFAIWTDKLGNWYRGAKSSRYETRALAYLLNNLGKFYHEATHFSDVLLLDEWARAVQNGAPVHPELKNVISGDGKIIDSGFYTLFMEPRAVVTEFESRRVYELIKGMTPSYFGASYIAENALAEAAFGGSAVEEAKRALGIHVGNVLQRTIQMEGWIRYSLQDDP